MQNEDKPEGEILDFTKPDFTFAPDGNHEWRQQGPYIVCKSCQLEHASWISISKQLVGIDKEGKPILKDVV